MAGRRYRPVCRQATRLQSNRLIDRKSLLTTSDVGQHLFDRVDHSVCAKLLQYCFPARRGKA